MNDIALLTNGETYFFRDHGQFDLLRLRLLPELIERRRDAKTLRLWSAGCSSGEEAYSLAMLLDMLLPKRDGWNILILGSDIDEAALAKARRGHYGQWSFRMAPPALKQRYFQRKGDEWMLDERIRSMVTFRTSNLIGETFPSAELRDMDLILCRNVFIYFGAACRGRRCGQTGCRAERRRLSHDRSHRTHRPSRAKSAEQIIRRRRGVSTGAAPLPVQRQFPSLSRIAQQCPLP